MKCLECLSVNNMAKTKKYNIERDGFFFMRGRVALYSILKALSIGEGDEVILQAFTCLAVPSPIMLLGAKPVYVDVDPAGYNMDLASLKSRITNRTKVIIVQHTFGFPADIVGIKKLAEQYNIPIVEDCCHSIGSTYDGREVGTFGVASFYSTEWAKPINTGIGGVLVLNEGKYRSSVDAMYGGMQPAPLKDILQLKAQYLAHSKLLVPCLYWGIRSIYRALSRKGLIVGTFSKEELEQKKPDYYEHLMSSWQKKILARKINDIDKDIQARRLLRYRYESFLKNIGIEPLGDITNSDPVMIRYPILVKDKESILEKAREKRIELGNWFESPVHPKEESEWGSIGYKKGACPIAEKLALTCVNLPIHNKIRERELNSIFSFITDNKNSIIGTCLKK